MSRRDNYWGWYKPRPKRPPPARGIRVKKAGSTWWGQRWIEALERTSVAYSNRLARGKTYARAGRVHDLTVKAGEVIAKVTGSRPTPYRIGIALAKLSDTAWARAIAAMASKAQFSAELLAGQMPREIDAAFKEAGASLFPAAVRDLQTSCSCPDVANPCKHVAATHYVLGEALDRDPFLLFELRGRTREQVLDALRAARGGEADARTPSRPRTRAKRGAETQAPREGTVPSISIGKVGDDDYDKLRAPLPALRLSFETPPISGVVLKQLGKPVAWSADASPVEMLGPILRAAAERARRMAMAGNGVPIGIARSRTGALNPATHSAFRDGSSLRSRIHLREPYACYWCYHLQI